MGLRKSTNLSGRGDTREDAVNGISGGHRSNNQRQADGIKGTRLDKHGDDSVAQSTDSSYPQGSASFPGLKDDPDADHKGEEDVE